MWQALRQAQPGDGSQSRVAELPHPPPAEEQERAYRCALCGELITRPAHRISVQGAHEHRFSNPAGYVFQIGCFQSAPGCLCAGDPEEFYSWFDGYTWRYALCRGCRAHLGWRFDPPDQAGSFFGLVLERLAG